LFNREWLYILFEKLKSLSFILIEQTFEKKLKKGYGKLDKARVTVRCQDAEKIKQTDGFP